MFSKCYLLFSLYIVCALAQVAPFTVTGFLDSATAGGTAFNSGGSVSVNGFDITIPDNLLVDFPAAVVPFAEFTEGDRAAPNEVTITGNIINGRIIAGQMSIAQLSLQFSNGYISSLGFDGSIKIANGPTIRINDPRARFSAGTKIFPFYTADDENPSVMSFGGFPMCVPRSADDAKCPQSNRPTNVNNPLNYVIPDPLHMAPLKVGDFVEFSGIHVNGEILCYEIVANVGIFTKGGEAPGFIRVEDAIVGIIDNNANTEFARSRFVGYVTDPSNLVQIYAMDTDPCTGEVTDRLIGSATPESAAGGRAKWEFRTDKNSIGTYTRNYRIKLASGTKETSDGILAGQYVQPVTEWIFPEVIVPGALQPPLDFSNIGHLANGFGPDEDGNVFHQLKPWPGATAPTVSKTCPDKVDPPTESTPPTTTGSTGTDPSSPSGSATSTPPAVSITADAGVDQIVRGGALVDLAAKQTTQNINAADLAFSWSQVSGPTAGVVLSTTTAPSTSFEAPIPGSSTPVNYTFQVLITHKPSGSTSKDNVTVTADITSVDHPVIDTFSWASKQSGTVTVIAHTELVNSAYTMKFKFGNNGAEQTLPKVGPGKFSYNARSTPQPANVQVRSYINNNPIGPWVIKTGPTAGKRGLGSSIRFTGI